MPRVIQVAWKSGLDWCLVSVSFEEPRIPSHEPHLSSRLSFSGSYSGGCGLRWGHGGYKLAGREGGSAAPPHGLWLVWAWNLCTPPPRSFWVIAVSFEGCRALRVLRAAGSKAGPTTSIQAPGPGHPPVLASPGWRPLCLWCRDAAPDTGDPDSCGHRHSGDTSPMPPARRLQKIYSQMARIWPQAQALAAKKYKDGHGILHVLTGEQVVRRKKAQGGWLVNG